MTGQATLANTSMGEAVCLHCAQPAPPGGRFCCSGCEAAYHAIEAFGLGGYYAQRILDRSARPPRPVAEEDWDLTRYIRQGANGVDELSLAVEGLQCGACVWLIESVLAQEPGVVTGRVNMTTRRLRLGWRGGPERAQALLRRIGTLGYRLVPFDPKSLAAARDRGLNELLRALAVAGFAASNVMLMSIGTWAGLTQGMGPATRGLMQFVSALIAMPAVVYAGRPFFRSAIAALRAGRTNMDVPVSVGVLLVTGISLSEALRGGEHTYFDSAIALLFFLLVGRVLDHRARGQARATAEQLLTLRTSDVALLLPDGATRRQSPEQVASGDRILVASGERIGADGVIEQGSGTIDASLITGESLPVAAKPGVSVFAGSVNLGEALIVRATATGAATLLAECVRLIEAAEAGRGRFVVLADRVARRYAPAVHLAALLTFLLWWLGLGAAASQSLLIAASVLIITCPCALALAVPAVQVIACTKLLRAGILLKSPSALERLATIDTVVFDKTGTLSEPDLAIAGTPGPDALRCAASLAGASRHPLARALTAAAALPFPVETANGVVEHPGAGLALQAPGGESRLGSARFCAVTETGQAAGPSVWLTRPGLAPLRFTFEERLREDAAATIGRLRRMGLRVILASGDTAPAVAHAAAALGITEVHAGCDPVAKATLVAALKNAGRQVLMAGDGLNDSPALASASASISPATASDLSQTVADVVFQGRWLMPVATALATARLARGVMRQNLALSIGYNVLMVPLAVAGMITPWLAAVAMSGSSLAVILNSLRAGRPAP